MGTPDFSAVVLDALIKSEHEINLVVTQPDKAKDRGKKLQFTPVKELALANGLEIAQPERVRGNDEFYELLKAKNPDIIVVVAYGQILPKEVLDLAKFGCINVHGSLLPKLRGASPIQASIYQGFEKTGITIMQMAEGMDTGDMLSKAEIEIARMNFEELHDALAKLGAELLLETLPKIENGEIEPEVQEDAQASYTKKISKQDGLIDFTRSPIEIERQIRAFDPWPGAYTFYNHKMMKIWKAQEMDKSYDEADGTIVDIDKESFTISCGGKGLKVLEIQMPGKKRVAVSAFFLGNKLEKGEVLQSE